MHDNEEDKPIEAEVVAVEEPATPRKKRPMPPRVYGKPLSIREKRFARAMMTAPNAETAAAKAGYAERSAHSTVSRLMQRDRVLREIDRLLEERYPDHEADFVAILRQQIEKAKSGAMTDRDVQSLLGFIAQMKGYAAPKEVKKLTATLKLPG